MAQDTVERRNLVVTLMRRDGHRCGSDKDLEGDFRGLFDDTPYFPGIRFNRLMISIKIFRIDRRLDGIRSEGLRNASLKECYSSMNTGYVDKI